MWPIEFAETEFMIIIFQETSAARSRLMTFQRRADESRSVGGLRKEVDRHSSLRAYIRLSTVEYINLFRVTHTNDPKFEEVD